MNQAFDPQLLEAALRQIEQLPRFTVTADFDPEFPCFTLHGFDQVASTNQMAWELLRQGASNGTVVIARRQSAGRGQRGHSWSSPAGGLYLSLGLNLDIPAVQGAELTLCSVCGIAMALRELEIPVGIKWLNDLVVDGRKLGGILTETRLQQGHIQQAVIGVGINWCNPVPLIGVNLQTLLEHLPADQAGSLPQSGEQPPLDSLEALAAWVLVGLKHGLCLWRHHGIAALMSSYEALLVNRGQPIQWQGHSGTILGITATGALRVQLAAVAPGSLGCFKEIELTPGSVSLGYGVPGLSLDAPGI